MLHVDTEKLGRIERPSHRVTGNRRDKVDGGGWEFLVVPIDDHARIAFTEIHPDGRFPSAVAFFRAAVAYWARLGVTIKRLLTDNGSAFRSRAFRGTCLDPGIRHKFARAHRPQTNGKAERFIRSALREWTYGIAHQHSNERTAMLANRQHHYNRHRPYAGIGGIPPMARLKSPSDNNVLTDHNWFIDQLVEADRDGGVNAVEQLAYEALRNPLPLRLSSSASTTAGRAWIRASWIERRLTGNG